MNFSGTLTLSKHSPSQQAHSSRGKKSIYHQTEEGAREEDNRGQPLSEIQARGHTQMRGGSIQGWFTSNVLAILYCELGLREAYETMILTLKKYLH